MRNRRADVARKEDLKIKQWIAVLASAACLVGCTGIPPEQLKNYAMIVPKENDASAITELDGHAEWHLSGTGVNVAAGQHVIQVTSCPITGTNGCVTQYYRFVAEMGKVYVLRASRQVDIYSRDNMGGIPIGHLHNNNGMDYITDDEFANKQTQVLQLAQQQAVDARTRWQADLPYIRKVGAKICSLNQAIFGFVEQVTDDKLQIRLEPSQQIIWDTPGNWDLCRS